MKFVHNTAETLANIIDLMVVAVLGIWILATVVLAARAYLKGNGHERIVYDIRVSLGRLILLALELLIVSDVLHSIASRTLEDLGNLAVVVVIRVFMAYFLDLELERLTKEGRAPGDK